MFTGIIGHVGEVLEVRGASSGKRLKLDLGPLAEDLRKGASIAVNGVCLTVCSVASSTAEFDVVTESLDRSTLSSLRGGERVNLERALSVNARVDGHIVQGHVDGTATVRSVRRGEKWIVIFNAARRLVDQMAPKGSVAVDGVSLTLLEVQNETFSVALIPTTLGATTLKDLAPGIEVNIETDVLGKYVRRFLENNLQLPPGGASGELTLDKLREAGFV